MLRAATRMLTGVTYCRPLKLFVIPYQRGGPSLSFWASCFLELFDATKFWHNRRLFAILWGVTITSMTGIQSVILPKLMQVATEAPAEWTGSEITLPCQVLPASQGSCQSFLIPPFSQQQMVVKRFPPSEKSSTGGINECLWIILKMCWIHRWIESWKVHIYPPPEWRIWKKNPETCVFDFHWFYSMGILKILF